ncbi:MAG: hypothetical protein OHK0026_08980 [Rhodocyclaceae bacterium]
MARTLVLRRSRLLALYLVALHAAAAAGAMLVEAPVPLRVLLAVAVAASALWNLARWMRPGVFGVESLDLLDDGSLRMRYASGEEIGARVLPASGVYPQAAVILARPQAGGHSRSVVVPADSCPADDFRTLKTWLRWRARTGSAG